MFLSQLSANFLIFFFGLFGVVFNRRNILIILMCIELLLLGLNLNFVMFSIYLDDMYGEIFSFFILTIAAAESAIGLAVIIIYYRIRGNINTNYSFIVKG
jgi:NADH:ubiquinone oxidoreductase subunit K